MFQKLKRYALSVFVVLIIGASLEVALPAAPAFAQTFGNDTYGSCSFGVSCPTTPDPDPDNPGQPDDTPKPGDTPAPAGPAAQTVIELPSGLEVAVNLRNGQRIPKAGYTIVVTPLNGRGTSFAEVRFDINGATEQTSKPDETGTVRWQWKPQSTGQTQVAVQVTGTNKEVVTQRFSVQVVADLAAPAPVTGTAAPTALAGPPVAQAVERFFRSLPSQVQRNFPYLLFVLLAIDGLLLLWLTYREVRERERLQAELRRLQSLNELRTTFSQLVSHYLRTPLSILKGGAEMLEGAPGVQPADAQRVVAGVHQLDTQITSLLTPATANQLPKPAPHAAVRVWLQPVLWVPVLLAGVLLLAFYYLAARAHTLPEQKIAVLLQLLVFVLLASGVYQVFRRWHLRRRDAAEIRNLLAHESHLAASRERLIADAAGSLRATLSQIDSSLQLLPANPSSRFLYDGMKRLHEMTAKFTIAASLRGAHSAKPFAPASLQALVGQAGQALSPEIRASDVTVHVSGQDTLQVQEPALLALVLQTLLENAASYSPKGGEIIVAAHAGAAGQFITVSDHGSGIPTGKLANLFEPFVKVEGAETFNHEGLGFSLYMDKLILAYLGGSIGLASEEGRGTTVTITLPVTHPAHGLPVRLPQATAHAREAAAQA
jgi:signal transduction histidine kinase